MDLIWVTCCILKLQLLIIVLIRSIIYGCNMGDMLQLHTLATIADIDLMGSTIYSSNNG